MRLLPKNDMIQLASGVYGIRDNNNARGVAEDPWELLQSEDAGSFASSVVVRGGNIAQVWSGTLRAC